MRKQPTKMVFRNFHQFAKLLKNCCCYDEVLLLTMTNVGSELAVCFPFSLKSFPLGPRHVGLSNLHHTVVNTTFFQSKVFFLYSRVEFASRWPVIGQLFIQLFKMFSGMLGFE